MKQADATVFGLAAKQHGLVSRAQALEAGVSSSGIDRRLANGSWTQVHPRVYRLHGAPVTEWQQVLAVCLFLGPEAFASHRTAAWLWKLDGFLDRPPFKIEVSAPHHKRLNLKGVELFRRRTPVEEYVVKEGIPTTVLTRTLADLATLLRPEALEIALDSAGRRYPDFFEALAEFVGATKGHGRKGYGRLGDLVQKRRGANATGSAFETRVLRAMRAANLPTPEPQYPVFVTDERPFAHLDFGWPAWKVALLVDGVGIHKSKRQFEKDAVQRALLTSIGWRWVNVTPDLLDEGTWLRTLKTLLSGPRAIGGRP